MVHDAARPLVSPALIERVLEGAVRWGSTIPVVPVKDTLKEVLGDRVLGTVDRSKVRAVQTPQGFALPVLKKAFFKVGHRASALTDDAAVVEAAGGRVWTVEGDPLNFKVTTPEDMKRAKDLVKNRGV